MPCPVRNIIYRGILLPSFSKIPNLCFLNEESDFHSDEY